MATSRREGSRTYGSRMKVGGWPNRGERNASRGPRVSTALQIQIALQVRDGGGEALDVGLRGVDGEAGPQRAADAEPPHERLGAVVSGADGDAPLIEQRRAVVRVDPLDVERYDRALDLRVPRPVDGDVGNRGECV